VESQLLHGLYPPLRGIGERLFGTQDYIMKFVMSFYFRVNARRDEMCAMLESVFLILGMTLTHVNVPYITMVNIANVSALCSLVTFYSSV